MNKSKHEVVVCPHCMLNFECKVNNIQHCQCANIKLSSDEVQYIREKYQSCLCISCLNKLRKEYNEQRFYLKIKKILNTHS